MLYNNQFLLYILCVLAYYVVFHCWLGSASAIGHDLKSFLIVWGHLGYSKVKFSISHQQCQSNYFVSV